MYVGDVVDENFSDFVADKSALVDVVLVHREQLLLVRHSQDHRHAGTVANAENFILRDGEDHIGECIVAETSDATVVDLFTDQIVVSCFLDLHEVHNAVVQSHQQFAGSAAVVQAKGLLGIPLGPNFDEFGGLEVALPGLNSTYLHELTTFALPGKLGICDFGIEAIHGTLVRSDDDEEVLLLYVGVITDTLTLSLHAVLQVQFWWVYHDFGCILIQLQELLHQLRVHEVISHDDLPQELLQACSTSLKLLLSHFEQVALLWKSGKGVICVLEPVVERVELGEALLHVPLVVFGLQL